MELKNYTPFPSIAWENVDSENNWYVTLVSKVKLDIKVQEKSSKLLLQLAKDQGELNLADVYNGEMGKSSVRYESDLVTYKKNTDVVLNAKAIAPDGKKKKSWDCGVKIFDVNNKLLKEYGLSVKGEKKFYKLGMVWSPGFRKKAYEIPIRYEKAYGGTIKTKKDKNIKTNIYNPVGCGMKKIRDPQQVVSSVQIKYLRNKLTKVPAGFGFIGRTWKNRLKYIGTYDKNWLENHHPLPPHDFDYLYNQAAHPELIMNGYLQAGTKIELFNLIKYWEKAYLEVPSFELISRLKFNTGDIFKKMDLDTLVIDIDDEDESKHCIYASYRTRIPKVLEVDESQIMLIQNRIKNG